MVEQDCCHPLLPVASRHKETGDRPDLIGVRAFERGGAFEARKCQTWAEIAPADRLVADESKNSKRRARFDPFTKLLFGSWAFQLMPALAFGHAPRLTPA